MNEAVTSQHNAEAISKWTEHPIELFPDILLSLNRARDASIRLKLVKLSLFLDMNVSNSLYSVHLCPERSLIERSPVSVADFAALGGKVERSLAWLSLS